MPNRKASTSETGFFSLKRRKSPESSDASNDQRRRITIACLRCRHRKIRCDGSDPCNKCKSAGTDCEYYAVTKEENQAAREKKALAKANRTKTLKVTPPQLGNSEEKRTASKRRSAKTHRTTTSASESSATREPVQYGAPEIPRERSQPNTDLQYSLAMPPQQHKPLQPVIEHPVEYDDSLSTSDGADNYFGYLSSSTTSLQSSVYDPVYNQDSLSYSAGHHEYSMPASAIAIDPALYAPYGLIHSDAKLQGPTQVPPPLSYPLDSPQPSGLCLYIPPEEATFSNSFSPYASVSTPVTPMLSQNYNLPHHSPPMYQGPIDWNSRPLVPFQDTQGHPRLHIQTHQHHLRQLHHQHQPAIHHRPRSYSDVPMYSQTVSLDQVCSAGV